MNKIPIQFIDLEIQESMIFNNSINNIIHTKQNRYNRYFMMRIIKKYLKYGFSLHKKIL
jgi:hypothetical protein